MPIQTNADRATGDRLSGRPVDASKVCQELQTGTCNSYKPNTQRHRYKNSNWQSLLTPGNPEVFKRFCGQLNAETITETLTQVLPTQ